MSSAKLDLIKTEVKKYLSTVENFSSLRYKDVRRTVEKALKLPKKTLDSYKDELKSFMRDETSSIQERRAKEKERIEYRKRRAEDSKSSSTTTSSTKRKQQKVSNVVVDDDDEEEEEEEVDDEATQEMEVDGSQTQSDNDNDNDGGDDSNTAVLVSATVVPKSKSASTAASSTKSSTKSTTKSSTESSQKSPSVQQPEKQKKNAKNKKKKNDGLQAGVDDDDVDVVTPSHPSTHDGHVSSGSDSNSKNEEEDPEPKRFLSPYMVFCNQCRIDLKKSYPLMTPVEIIKRIGELWRELPPEKKKKCEEESKVQQVRYKQLLSEWIDRNPTRRRQTQIKKEKKQLRLLSKSDDPFTRYSRQITQQLKSSHPSLTTPQIKTMVKEQWNALTEEERRKCVGEGREEGSVKKKKKDKDAIKKRSKNAFVCFCSEKRNELRQQFPNMKMSEMQKIFGEMWASMTESQKVPYGQLALEEKEKTKAELEKMKSMIDNSSIPFSTLSTTSSLTPSLTPPTEVKKEKKKRSTFPYRFFIKEYTAKLRADNPKMELGEISQLCSQQWKTLSDEDKQPYVELAKQETAMRDGGKGSGGEISSTSSSSSSTSSSSSLQLKVPLIASEFTSLNSPSAFDIFKGEMKKRFHGDQPSLKGAELKKEIMKEWENADAVTKSSYENVAHSFRLQIIQTEENLKKGK